MADAKTKQKTSGQQPTFEDFIKTGFYSSAEIAALQEQLSRLNLTDKNARKQAEALYKPAFDLQQAEYNNQLEQLAVSRDQEIKRLNSQYDRSLNSLLANLNARNMGRSSLVATQGAETENARNAAIADTSYNYLLKQNELNAELQKANASYAQSVEAKATDLKRENDAQRIQLIGQIAQLQQSGFTAYTNYLTQADLLGNEQARLANERLAYQTNLAKLENERLAYQNNQAKIENERLDYKNSQALLDNERIAYQNNQAKIENERLAYQTNAAKLENERIAYQNNQEKIRNEQIAYQNSAAKVENERLAYQNNLEKIRNEQIAYQNNVERLTNERLTSQNNQTKVNNELIALQNSQAKIANEKLALDNERAKLENQKYSTEIAAKQAKVKLPAQTNGLYTG